MRVSGMRTGPWWEATYDRGSNGCRSIRVVISSSVERDAAHHRCDCCIYVRNGFGLRGKRRIPAVEDWNIPVFGFIRLDRLVLDFSNLILVAEMIISEVDSSWIIMVDGCLVLGCLLQKANVLLAAVQQIRNQMFVDDMALELLRWNDVAVAELKMLDEEACAVERLLAADAGELLVDFVVELDVALQA